MAKDLRVTTRNASFQQWQALLTNRAKRQRSGEFLVQGVRPIDQALEHRWPIRALIYADGEVRSRWARDALDRVDARRVAMAPELVHELGGKAEEVPELLAVVGMREDSLTRIPVGPGLLVVVFDRPTGPGNVGTLVRSADALGASGVIITGHAADPYDPKAVRASTGSLFAVPVVRCGTHREVVDWVTTVRTGGIGAQIVGTDEHGSVEVAEHDLTGPTVVVIGNETQGLSAAWRQSTDLTVRIPITGAASSLNAATAASVVMYETSRQRSHAVRPG